MNPAQRQIALRKMALPVIPDDWEMVTVGSIAQKKPNSIVGGPFGSDLVSTDYVPAGVPVIRGQNMGQAIVSGDFVFVSDEKAKALSSNLAAPGDVVFTQRGTLGQVSVVPDSPFDRYLISQSQMKLSVDPQRFDVAFLCQYFSSAAGQQQILESAIQTGVPHTNLAILRGYFLPRPPLPEQQVIAAALSDAEGVVAGLELVIAKKRLIKQGAMQDLLTARRRLPGFSGEWEVKKLGTFCRLEMGGTPSRLNAIYWGKGYPWLTIADMQSKVINASKEQVTDQGAALLTPVKAGTLMMSFKLSIGRLAFAGIDLFTNEAICSFNDLTEDADFLFYALSRTDFALYGKQAVKGYTLNKQSLKEVEVLLPGKKEQQAIAAVLSDMDAEIQTLGSRLAKARAVKQGMMQNLLTGRVRLV